MTATTRLWTGLVVLILTNCGSLSFTLRRDCLEDQALHVEFSRGLLSALPATRHLLSNAFDCSCASRTVEYCLNFLERILKQRVTARERLKLGACNEVAGCNTYCRYCKNGQACAAAHKLLCSDRSALGQAKWRAEAAVCLFREW